MKSYFIILLFIVIGVLSPSTVTAAPGIIIVDMNQHSNEQVEKPITEKGKRCPSVKYYFSINLEDYAVETDIPDTIILYEIMDEDGSTLLASSLSSEVAMYLSSVDGVFQLRLVTADNTYIGYIEL